MTGKDSGRRNQLIRLIHVAKRDLGMADDTYRAIIRKIGNTDSSATLSISNLEAVLEHMKKAGFKVRPKAARTTRPSRPVTAREPEHSKIRAIWLMLHELGAVRDPSERALAAYCQRMTGVEALEWVNGSQSHTMIESLKKWAQRHLPAATQRLGRQLDMDSLPAEEHEHVHAALFGINEGSFDSLLRAYEYLKFLEGYRRTDVEEV